jgi:hypothetical protein
VDLGPGIRAGFTSRAGGVSVGSWEGLDLGHHVGDDPVAVARNRALLAAWAGGPVRFGNQVHGTRAVTVPADGGGGPVPGGSTDPGPDGGGCDALVAAEAGVPVGVLVADCVPVLLADPQAAVVAAAHAGRRGLLDGILQRTLEEMVRRGARPDRVRAVLGPSAGPCCYEVPAELQAQACATLPALRATTRGGTPSLDLRAGCSSVLAEGGVARVDTAGGCTIDDLSYYSYRRAAVTGRFAGVVTLLP